MRLFPKFTRRMLLKSGSLSLIGLGLRDSLNWRSRRTMSTRDHAHFVNPPDEARPWVYWYFMDGHLAPEGMTADLEAMKRAGIGGGVYLEVGIGIPPGPVRFMSESWQQTVADAFGRADELGLEIALAAGAGWCGAGGPWVKPEESMQFLVTSETRVHGPGKFSGQLPTTKTEDAVLRRRNADAGAASDMGGLLHRFMRACFSRAAGRRRRRRIWRKRRSICGVRTLRKFSGRIQRCRGCGHSCRAVLRIRRLRGGSA